MIAIIGVLVALLLPAVQAAREAARRSSCENNLRQLGLALQTYHDAHKAFPANSPWSLDPPRVKPEDRKGSMLVRLLPHLEGGAYFQRIDFDGDVVGLLDAHPELKPVTLDVLLCPTDVHPRVNRNSRGTTSYGPSVGAQAVVTLAKGDCRDLYKGNMFDTGPIAHANTTSLEDTSGLFSRQGYAANLAQVTDGSSHTIAMGELVYECNFELDRFGFYDSQIWYVGTATPINYNTCRDTPPGNDGSKGWDCYSWDNWGTSAGFKSRHIGGAAFVFADGSVHFITENIDYRNYQRLGCRRDGETVEPF